VRRLALLAALALLALPALAAAPLPEKLPEKYGQWISEVAPLLTDEERATFLALAKDYQRDAFIESFWKARDPFPATSRNELRERWQANVEEARARFNGDLTDERARVLLLNGPPAELVTSDCPNLLVPLEVWFYQGSDQLAEPFIVLFYRKWGSTPFRVWHPQDGEEVLYAESLAMPDATGTCGDPEKARKIAAALRWIAGQGMHWDILAARFEHPQQRARGEWIATFNSYSTDVPADAAPLPARLEVAFPGRRQSRTVVQGVVTVAAADATEGRVGEHRSYDFLLTGEVLREGVLFDSFRYKFDLPPGEASLPLTFQRWLRPGDYTLVIKVEDVSSGRLFRAEQPLSVPERASEAAAPSTPEAAESARLLAEATDALSSGEPAVRIVRPHGEMQTGMQRFDTLTAGAGIAGVTFTLDGKPVLTKKKPPFSVELDLGSIPHTRTLAATAFAADGAELAHDELTLNAAGHRFRVHLREPQRGRRYSGTLLARAETEAPEGETVERVEIYLNETRVATLYQPPWVQPVALPPGQPVAYVRAVAWLADGSSTEDLAFINAPANLEQMNVDAVELYASVLDRDGHPVAGLAAEDFTVLEDGKKQEIARFERVTDLPIHAAVALDVSASMAGSLERAREAALRFLKRTVRPQDRAAVIPFNDHPTLAVKFTHDLDTLAGGLAGLKAERGTVLYDTLAFALYYFNGVKGQRAILLLSDGKDEGSRFTWEETLEFARRAGVAIYPIGLGDQVEKRKLARLAEETGGRAFFLDDAARLDEIYDRIEEELRSQYLLVYQSGHAVGDTAFRTVDLQIAKKGLEAKTIRGYYP
jgi:Ca-activated chloride channel family protein